MIRDSQPGLTALGRLAEQSWRKLPQWYPAVKLDAYVIMPNHIHGILLLLPLQSAAYSRTSAGTGAVSLLNIMRAFKSTVAREWHQHCGDAVPVWQRGFYDHVIRDEQALYSIREYITWNPAQWHLDQENDSRSAINPFYSWLEEQGKLKLL